MHACTDYPLSDPRVRSARADFYRQRRKSKTLQRCTLSFETLYGLLCDKSVSLGEIARRTRLHPSTVQRLNEGTFAQICGQRLGSERYEARVREALERKKARLALALPDSDAVRTVAAGARARGLAVEACLMRDRLLVVRSKLLIEGRECLLHPITKAAKASPNHRYRYGIALIHRDKLAESVMHLFPVLIRGQGATYILPSDVLLGLFNDSPNRQERLYIPLHADVRRTGRSVSRIELDGYKDAWHLLAA
ncbi:MAG: hypothetical protein V4644_01195 [Patescibacteria group bacterium]